MTWQCLYFFDYTSQDIQSSIVEVKRTNLPKSVPREQRFFWLRIFTQSIQSKRYTRVWRMPFLAQGKTVDGDEYRILKDGGGHPQLFLFNDTTLTLPDRVQFERKDPQSLPDKLKARITAQLSTYKVTG